MDAEKFEGFWFSEWEPEWPKPVAHPEWPMDAERSQQWVLDRLSYIERKAQIISYRGPSFCRVCNKLNGTQSFTFKGWEWPSGFRHYIEEHNVVPSTEFLRMLDTCQQST